MQLPPRARHPTSRLSARHPLPSVTGISTSPTPPTSRSLGIGRFTPRPMGRVPSKYNRGAVHGVNQQSAMWRRQAARLRLGVTERALFVVTVTADRNEWGNTGRATSPGMLHCMSPLLAQSGHANHSQRCPLLEVKRTLHRHHGMSAFDPNRKSGCQLL